MFVCLRGVVLRESSVLCSGVRSGLRMYGKLGRIVREGEDSAFLSKMDVRSLWRSRTRISQLLGDVDVSECVRLEEGVMRREYAGEDGEVLFKAVPDECGIEEDGIIDVGTSPLSVLSFDEKEGKKVQKNLVKEEERMTAEEVSGDNILKNEGVYASSDVSGCFKNVERNLGKLPSFGEVLDMMPGGSGFVKRVANVSDETVDDGKDDCLVVGGRGAVIRLNGVYMVCGWSRTLREGGNGKFCFIELNDGSTGRNLQVVVQDCIIGFTELLKGGKVGASLQVVGKLIRSPGKNQIVELQCDDAKLHSVKILGGTEPAVYPLTKKRHSKEFLREIAHLRPRTNLFGAVTRMRSSLAMAVHTFFLKNNYLYIHTPIITASDCEGAGEMFQVTTILPGENEYTTAAAATTQQKEHAEQTPSASASKKTEKGGHEANIQQQSSPFSFEAAADDNGAATRKIKVNYSHDFFERPSFLTVSGQLDVENFCCALGDVYTFGPTFRAENSHTSRHLAEFWMIEPEMAFADMFDLMTMAEAFVKFCVKWVLNYSASDLKILQDIHAFSESSNNAAAASISKRQPQKSKANKNSDRQRQHVAAEKKQSEDTQKSGCDNDEGATPTAETVEVVKLGLIDSLKVLLSRKFARIPYSEAVEMLSAYNSIFSEKVEWGQDLATEHERFLCEKLLGGSPVFVYNYPKDIKSFYMRLNDDQTTVAAMDLLLPGIGELIGGSQREERFDVLNQRILDKNLNAANYWWYKELRKYGSVIHSGFGLGFERLVMLCTGLDNIRDVIPFPRYPGHAEF